MALLTRMADLTTLLSKFLVDLYAGTVTLTGSVTVPRVFGTASATLPAFSITGDTNTGFGASAADTAAIWAGGTTPVLTATSTAVTSSVPLTINANGGVTLVDDAANILAQRNGTATQELRIGPAASYLYLNKINSNASAIGTFDGAAFELGTNNTTRWYLAGATGHLLAATDNTYDIGASGATRPRNIYAGTDITSGRDVFATRHLYLIGTDGQLFFANGARSTVFSPADGQLNFERTGAAAGVGLDFTTDAIFKVHTRAQTGYATVDALAYQVSGTQVVGAQGAAVADASGGATVDAEARTALNALLARLRTHGLIAT